MPAPRSRRLIVNDRERGIQDVFTLPGDPRLNRSAGTPVRANSVTGRNPLPAGTRGRFIGGGGRAAGNPRPGGGNATDGLVTRVTQGARSSSTTTRPRAPRRPRATRG